MAANCTKQNRVGENERLTSAPAPRLNRRRRRSRRAVLPRPRGPPIGNERMGRFTIRQFVRDPRAKAAVAFAAGSLAIAFLLYSPALRGDFVLDDLPLGVATVRPHPLDNWMWRPRLVLML